MSGLKQRSVALAIGMGSSLLLSSQLATASGAWYIGLGGGASQLNPDTTTSAFALEEEQGTATGVYLGLDINDWLSAEAAYTDLGEAGLSGDQYIGYTAASIGGIAYIYRNRGMDSRQSGMSGYVRLGLNSITNESDIQLNEADNTAVWIGAGLQYPVTERLGLRAELASFDGDAQVAMASVYWRSRADGDYDSGGGFTTGSSAPRTPVSRDDEFTAEDFDEVEEFESYDVDADSEFDDATMMDSEDPFETEMMDSEDPFETLDAEPGFDDFPVASSAECNAPAAGEPTDASGCAMFTGVVEGVGFDGDTAILTVDSEFLLSSLAMSMNDYPRLTIELQIHTQEYAEPGRAMQLSRERVMAVARFLAAEGVNVQRLRARAFGSAEPRFEDGSPESRRLNNRLALRVL